MEKDYFYLKGTEELGDIIDLVRNVKAKELILVVPPKTKALTHPVNLELFKREIDRCKKKVYLSSEDEELARLAKAAGFDLFLGEYEASIKGAQIVTDIRPPARAKDKVEVKEQLEEPLASIKTSPTPSSVLATSSVRRPTNVSIDKVTSQPRRFNFKKILIIFVSVLVIFWVISFAVGSFGGSAKVKLTIKKQATNI